MWIRGPAVMQGYWGDPQATREAFCDGWFRSGDLGLINPDGSVQIVDRVKDVIIVGSSNVYPADLESLLAGCPAIAQAAVVARPHDQLGEAPVAFVVLKQPGTMTATDVKRLFDGRLADYKHPDEVILIDSLPRNATGKIDKARLRQLAVHSSAPGFG